MQDSTNHAGLLEQAKELVSREIKLCKTLRAMISRELEAIVLNADMDELFNILEQKDGIISQLQLLADSWQDVIPSNLHNNANNFVPRLLELYPDDDELPGMLQESREIAESIIQAEDEAMSELDKFTSGLRSQMTARVHGKNAAASYARMGGSII
ncbi:MAG: hypothetical protein IJP48_10185 [Synergistaceae bacterium]|nr:hypothetical protein [Synergistaceae bacterium]